MIRDGAHHYGVLGAHCKSARGFTPEDANFVQAVEERQGMMISCPEEIAYRMGYIGKEEVNRLALAMDNNEYGRYLLRLLDEDIPFHSS